MAGDSRGGKRLITAKNVEELLEQGSSSITVDKTMILAPGAKDLLRNRGITICWAQEGSVTEKPSPQPAAEPVGEEQVAATVVRLLNEQFGVTEPEELQKISMEVMKKLCA